VAKVSGPSYRGRSLQDLVGFLGELQGKGIDLYLHQQGLDTSTPAGHAMFGMLGVFAEFERALITPRIKASIARARANGKRLGRPKIPASTEAKVTDWQKAMASSRRRGYTRWVLVSFSVSK